ncbi:hypothetical protein DI272_01795 [Streptomyces sp. Act143]|uniref:PASTA domain-containing protein n=1 Tax=Streptomyces sp. Act143 TaxID=2200760 RepID=UPI000D68203C|nr:PASTA domain-containing protein [Streptomyces sp. Act143]PWI13009.1 hypothetical protein DI272_01795 [Streptomyces sp. Act143]
MTDFAGALVTQESPSPSPADGVDTLTWGQSLTVLVIMGGVVLAVGFIVIFARWALAPRRRRVEPAAAQNDEKVNEKAIETDGVVRSWLAIAFAAGALILVPITFALQDSTTRNVLIGALVATLSAATTFYFTTKSAQEAQQNLLKAQGTERVPDLVGFTLTEARKITSVSSLILDVDPNTPDGQNKRVRTVQPTAGTEITKGAHVTLTLG